MTPVEERIDHEEAKGIADRNHQVIWSHLTAPPPDTPHSDDCPGCLIDALLTEHSAREELIEAGTTLADIAASAVCEPRRFHENEGDHQQALSLAVAQWRLLVAALPATEPAQPRCSGYCIGTRSVETLVEDLACPVHGVGAQCRAALTYPDRQAWLDALAEPAQPEEDHEPPCEHGIAWGEFCPRCPGGGV